MGLRNYHVITIKQRTVLRVDGNCEGDHCKVAEGQPSAGRYPSFSSNALVSCSLIFGEVTFCPTTSVFETYSQLQPSTVWLREVLGSRAYFPDDICTKFDLPNNVRLLIVEGGDPAVPGSRKRKLATSSHFSYSDHMRLPLGIHKLLQDAFKCNICCSSPIKPPVIFSRCCKRLLGCQECVDRWFGGDDGVTRSCPLCRREQAYADTCILKGLDDLLTGILPLMNGTTVATDDSDREDLPSAQ